MYKFRNVRSLYPTIYPKSTFFRQFKKRHPGFCIVRCYGCESVTNWQLSSVPFAGKRLNRCRKEDDPLQMNSNSLHYPCFFFASEICRAEVDNALCGRDFTLLSLCAKKILLNSCLKEERQALGKVLAKQRVARKKCVFVPG